MLLRKLGYALTILLFAFTARAENRPGSISGFVRSATGAPQMGAIVEVFTSASNSITVFTNERGFYAATGLLPGLYNVRVSVPSFLPSVRERLTLRSGATLLVNLTLSTIFQGLQVSPRSTVADDDDWKWTLRSVASRPVLRVFDPSGKASEKEKAQEPALRTSLAFLAGSDSDRYGGASDLNTHFLLEHSVSPQGTVAFGGNFGYGSSAPSALLTASYKHNLPNGSTPEVAFTFRRLAAPDPILRDAALAALSVRVSDSMSFGDVLELHFGSEMQTVQFMRRVNAALPFGTADIHLNPNTVLEYSYMSAVPEDSGEVDLKRTSEKVLDFSPRISIRGFNPALERLHHHEVSLAHRSGKNRVMVALYSDRVGDPALLGVGSASSENGEVLQNAYSGTFSYQGPDFSARGMRAVLQRKLTEDLTATLDYAYGGVLDLGTENVSLDSARSSMRRENRHAFSARMNGVIPASKTHWMTSYRWTGGRALTPVDMFNGSAGAAQPFLNVMVRQPLPGMPGHMEALLDLRNLLAEGYVPVIGQDGRTVYLVQSERAIRGGVAFTF